MKLQALWLLSSTIVVLSPPLSSYAQTKAPNVSVPFVGCKSDGQVGPVEVPVASSKTVAVSPDAAKQLAYYKAGVGEGVLAPRGWYCFALYGSGGDQLYVSPSPIRSGDLFSTKDAGFTGPAIELSHRFGDTMGRFGVARVIARVFPAYKLFVKGVMEMFDEPESEYAWGPYPTDTLNYTGKSVVEFRTPQQTEGLGTDSFLKKNGEPIVGVAMLVGETPDLLMLSIRLGPGREGLTSAIIAQVERDGAGLK